MSPKKCVFGCDGKLTLFSFPKNAVLREQWMHFVFPGQQRSCTHVFVCSRHFRDECFNNKAQFDAGFADRLKLKDKSVPAIKDPGHESEKQAMSMMVQVDVMCCKSVGTDLSMLDIDDLMTEICQLKRELELLETKLRERDELDKKDVSLSSGLFTDQSSTELLLSVCDEEQKASVNLLACEIKLKTEITEQQIDEILIHSDLMEVKQESSEPDETEEKPHHLTAGEEAPGNLKTEKNLSAKKSQRATDSDCHMCPVCGKIFTCKFNLNAHMINHTGENHHTCDQCGKIFTTKCLLIRHMHIHKREWTYRCEQCGQTFSHKHGLKMHMRIHVGEKTHTCEECGKTFIRKEDLNAHTRFHTGENLHTCDKCGKVFVHKSRFTVHMKIHNGDKPYRCAQCGKRFMWPNALKQHLLHHSGVRLFPCELCSKAFIKSSDLKRHVKTHAVVKPYVCSVCGKAYSELNYFKRHEKMHTGVSPHMCVECGKTFTTSSYLKKHRRLHTGENVALPT